MDTTARDHTNRIARIAWFCAFVLPLILAVVLLVVKSANALPPLPVPAAQALEDASEEELQAEEEAEKEAGDAEEAQEECELAREEFQEGEVDKKELEGACSGVKGGTGTSAGSGCPLRSIHVHAAEQHDTLKVTVGYTSSAATAATVEVRSGSRRIASLHRQLGRSGVIRIVKKVGKKTIHRITVRVNAPSCSKPKTASTNVG